jgi:ABC-type branched-subunit amino acid transport system ATPase component
MSALPSDVGGGADLTVRSLSHAYDGIVALHDVSFAVERGSVCCVLGPNGAGKTTLGGCLAGLLPTSPGTVSLNGADVSGCSLHERAQMGVAYLPEGGDIFPSLSVADNLVVGAASVRRAFRAEQIEQATELFPFIGVRRRTQAGMLSGGEQQMLSLARIIIQAPALAIVDELSHGLAPAIVESLFNTLAEKKGPTTFFLIEQYLHRALGVADSILVLSRGRVAYAGATSSTTAEQVEQFYRLDVPDPTGPDDIVDPGKVT